MRVEQCVVLCVRQQSWATRVIMDVRTFGGRASVRARARACASETTNGGRTKATFSIGENGISILLPAPAMSIDRLVRDRRELVSFAVNLDRNEEDQTINSRLYNKVTGSDQEQFDEFPLNI